MMAALGFRWDDPGKKPGGVEATDPAFQAQIWEVRTQGLNIMMSMKSAGKLVSFVEDCAVELKDLAEFTDRLTRVFRKHGTDGTWYAHASVGLLHVRPVLNLQDRAGGQATPRHRRGSLRHRCRIQGLTFRRARRRDRAFRVP